MIHSSEKKDNFTDLDFAGIVILQLLSFNAIDDQRHKDLYWEIWVMN